MSVCIKSDCEFKRHQFGSQRSLEDCTPQEIDHIFMHLWGELRAAPPIRYPYWMHFTTFGLHIEGYVTSHLHHPILTNSRGVFLKNIPATSTIATILSHIRGGALERIDFQNHQQRTCVGVFFILAQHAEAYIKCVRRVGGVSWGGEHLSSVEAIPRSKGGHEPIKMNVARAIREEGATRVLVVEKLPAGTEVELLKQQVRRQSSNLAVEFEAVTIDEDRRVAVVKMASIGTALGARLRLGKLKWYSGCKYSFARDECEGGLSSLMNRWEREKEMEDFQNWAQVIGGELTRPTGTNMNGISTESPRAVVKSLPVPSAKEKEDISMWTQGISEEPIEIDINENPNINETSTESKEMPMTAVNPTPSPITPTDGKDDFFTWARGIDKRPMTVIETDINEKSTASSASGEPTETPMSEVSLLSFALITFEEEDDFWWPQERPTTTGINSAYASTDSLPASVRITGESNRPGSVMGVRVLPRTRDTIEW